MKIDCVTITGADDKTNIEEMLEISKEFPYVEWGILFSKSQEGGYRFPSRGWIEQLMMERQRQSPHMRLSAHLCGRWVRELMIGELNIQPTEKPWALTDIFRRLQLNFHAERHSVDLAAFAAQIRQIDARQQIIFQLDGVNDDYLRQAQEAGLHVAGLFDASGGAGITPEEWPHPLENIYCGYAGGLGPNNIEAQLQNLDEYVIEKDRHIWIDMERNVRTPDDSKLDMKKVRICLEAARPYINPDA